MDYKTKSFVFILLSQWMEAGVHGVTMEIVQSRVGQGVSQGQDSVQTQRHPVTEPSVLVVA